MRFQKVFEYEFKDEWYVHELHTYYRGVNCWFEIIRKLNEPDNVKFYDNLLEAWKSETKEIPNELLDKAQHPLTMYRIDRKEGFYVNRFVMSLYEFCALVLEIPFGKIPKPLRSAYIQIDENGPNREIACENCDDESWMTEKNYRIVERELKKLQPDLKKHFGDYDFYLHLVGGHFEEEGHDHMRTGRSYLPENAAAESPVSRAD